ncbi:MAG: hypothetical protein CM1200mP16_17300 [Nitrospina sp.]|nr:MAG: hypothetical protein CM1200mP16_17300 [Nitrospina sp.]
MYLIALLKKKKGKAIENFKKIIRSLMSRKMPEMEVSYLQKIPCTMLKILMLKSSGLL